MMLRTILSHFGFHSLSDEMPSYKIDCDDEHYILKEYEGSVFKMVNNYIVDKKYVDETGSTNFYEFRKGKINYDVEETPFWKDDSIYLEDNLVWILKLDDLFSKVLEDYDCTGDTPVNRQQWNQIVEVALQSGDKWEEVIKEMSSWVEETFRDYDFFTIIGM